MAQRVLVDFQPTVGVGQRTVADEVGCALRRHHVQQFEGDFFAHALAVHRRFEHRDVVLAAHFHQGLAELRLRAIRHHHFVQCLGVKRNAEHRGRGGAKLQARRLHAAATERVGRKVQRFLRRARAFHCARGLGEDGIAALEFFDQLPRIRCKVVAVIAGDAMLAQGAFKSRNRVPVDLDAGRDHQVLVGDAAAVGEFDLVFVRQQPGYAFGYVAHATRQHFADAAAGGFRTVGAAADQRPCGLVIVMRRRFDHCDVEFRLVAAQSCRDRDAAGAGADDDHRVLADGCSHAALDCP